MSNTKIVGVYLAAGKSKRFGADKLLAVLHDKPLASIAFQTAMRSKLEHILIVTQRGDTLSWLPEEMKSSKSNWTQIECDDAVKGQSYSLCCGLVAAEALAADAIVVLLADQPYITVTMINDIIQHFVENKQLLFVGTMHNQIISPPMLLSSALFPEISHLTGDSGANKIIREKRQQGYLIDVNNQDVLLDVDTMEDYWKLYPKKDQ